MIRLLSIAILLLLAAPLNAAERRGPRRDAPPATRPASEPAAAADETRVPITIAGGHETDPRDHGRPVILVAAGLKVPEEVFRETFTHVHPSRNGPPDGELARRNKQALRDGLGKYGVTNDRLDEVSNFYRYQSSKGEMWRNTPAEGYAVVKNGAITAVVLTNAGAGYSSEPKVTVKGFDNVQLKTTLSFGIDLQKNGSIKEISVVPPSR